MHETKSTHSCNKMIQLLSLRRKSKKLEATTAVLHQDHQLFPQLLNKKVIKKMMIRKKRKDHWYPCKNGSSTILQDDATFDDLQVQLDIKTFGSPKADPKVLNDFLRSSIARRSLMTQFWVA